MRTVEWRNIGGGYELCFDSSGTRADARFIRFPTFLGASVATSEYLRSGKFPNKQDGITTQPEKETLFMRLRKWFAPLFLVGMLAATAVGCGSEKVERYFIVAPDTTAAPVDSCLALCPYENEPLKCEEWAKVNCPE